MTLDTTGTAVPRRIGDWRAIIAAGALDVTLSPEAERILDVPTGTRPAPRDLLALLEPEARARLQPTLLREWRTGESWDLEFRCRTLGGRPVMLRSLGCVVERRPGLVLLLGTIEEITPAEMSPGAKAGAPLDAPLGGVRPPRT